MIHVGRPEDVPPAQFPQALVSLAVGGAYLALWEKCARPSWEAYARRCGYDVIVLTRAIDPEDAARRSPAWQKCLIPAQPWARRYRRLVWLDADIVIGPQAPDVAAQTPDGKAGATLVNDQCSDAEKEILLEVFGQAAAAGEPSETAWGRLQNRIYHANGVDTPEERMIATGVIVSEPARHAELFLQAYSRPQRSRNYEQPALSHALLSAEVFHRLSPRWNWGVWDVLCLHFRDLSHTPLSKPLLCALINQQLRNAYFLHFYQCDWLLRALSDQQWGPEGPTATEGAVGIGF
jgi:hypothetical protein